MLALPHVVTTDPIEANGIALVAGHDRRLRQLTSTHPNFSAFLSRFWDEFGGQIAPSVVIWRDDLPNSARTFEALSGFRDAIALSIIPYAWARVQSYNRPQGIRYSEWFSFYPWMIDKDYKYIIAQTYSVLALHQVEKLHAQSIPCVSHEVIQAHDIDKPLLDSLLSRWEARFCVETPTVADVALFRSLNMAHASAMQPTQAGTTTYDSGRSISLWASAFEILTPSRNNAYGKILQLLKAPKWENGKNTSATYKTYGTGTPQPLPCWLYGELHQARNDFLHGNEIKSSHLSAPSGRNIFYYASILYRMALAGYLGLQWTKPMPSSEDAKAFGTYIAEQLEYKSYQRLFERALATILEPPDDD